MANKSLAGKTKGECEAEFNISVNGLLILSEEEFAKKYTKDGKTVNIDFETNREAFIDFRLQNLVSTYFESLGSPMTKLNAEMELKMLVEELEALKGNSGTPPLKDNSGLPEYVFSRDGEKRGKVTGSTHPCQMEGCRGRRITVKWEDGTWTFPCGKGMKLREDGSYQII